MVGSAAAQSPYSPEQLADPAWRSQRLDEAHRQAVEIRANKDLAGCQAVGPRMQPLLDRDWTIRSFRVWSVAPSCWLIPGGAWTLRQPTPDEVRATWAPALAHFARMPDAARVASNLEVDVWLGYWNILDYVGHVDLAFRERRATVQAWIDRASAHPGDAVAASYLTQLGRAIYGQRWLASWMKELQGQFAQALGPGHPATLHMMQARIFAFRQIEQPAEALALSDEYARLAAEHHPGNERLQMANRSERIGALAGVGRFADAIDEGQALLAWQRQQQPVPYGNIMRTAYNLMGVAMDMGDLDGAVEYARLSREQGLKADNTHDRAESDFAELLLQQARTARGDPGAWHELKRKVDAVVSWDLPAVEPVHVLFKAASAAGDEPAAQQAREHIARVVRGSSLPLQAARALPLVLQAQAAAPGSDAALQAASQALAVGLAHQQPAAQVVPFFELARQVGPDQAEGAIWLCKHAAQGLVQMRKGLAEDVPGLPQAWQREHEADLRACIARLVDAGRLAEAEQALRVLREEELHEFTRRSRGPLVRREGLAGLSWTQQEKARNVALQPITQVLQREAAAARARAQAQISAAQRMGGDDAEADAAVSHAAAQLRSLLPAAPGQAQGPTAEVPAGTMHPGQTLPPGQARLTYWLGASRAEAWVQVASRLHRVPLAASVQDINRTVQSLRSELRRPQATVPMQAQTLHRWLVAPVQARLKGVRWLQLVPDGALRYLPFAALHDGQRYLAERYVLGIELAQTTGAAPARPVQRGAALAAFGRSLPDADHAALPGVQDELASLGELRAITVKQAQDAAFTRAALRTTLQEGRPQVVHLATHFVLDAAGEESSYLLLGDGERLPLRELRQLPWHGVRLAFLSACDTGLALPTGDKGKGREWAGFAAALQAAGVPYVLATLWRIEDASTAQWVKLFFQPWQRPGAMAQLDAAHLAATQRAWLRRHRGKAWAHPYHWAGFQWLGAVSAAGSSP